MDKLKLLAAAACTAILLVSLCSCGGSKIEVTDEPSDNTEETQTGTVAVWSEETQNDGVSVCDAGKISVTVPDGWKAFAVDDIMGDYNSDHNPNAINVYKGAVNQLDTRSTPYIEIRYYGADSTEFTAETERDLYSSVEEIKSLKLGNYTWNGFCGTNGGTNIAVLTAESDDGGSLTLTAFMNVGTTEISLEDEDVRAVISAITVKPEN